MKRKVIALLLVLGMMFSLIACSSGTPAASAAPTESAASTAPAASGKFLIGIYLQLTGTNSVAGNAGKQGIDLAIKYINANGGFNGEAVEAKYYDTTGNPEEAVKVVKKMITSDNVDAIIGSVNSNEVSACIGYINDAKIFNFGLGTAATWMADTSKIWTFRASANNNRIAPQDADLILELGYKNVAIISGTDDTGKSTATAFQEACEKKGLKVTTRQECDTADTDFSGQITQILNTDPDCIFMSLIGTTYGPFVKQVRNMGYKGMLACKESFSLDYQKVVGKENSNYIFYASPYVPYTAIEDCSIPIMKEFLQKFYDEYKQMPQIEAAYRGWDTMMAMWEATKISGKNDSNSLREAMNKVKIDGLGGTLDYTKGDREGYSAFNSFVLVDGKNILLKDWMSSGGYDAYKKATGRNR